MSQFMGFPLVFVSVLTALVLESQGECVIDAPRPLDEDQHGLLSDPFAGLNDEFDAMPKIADALFDSTEDVTHMSGLSHFLTGFQLPSLHTLVFDFVAFAIVLWWTWTHSSLNVGRVDTQNSKIAASPTESSDTCALSAVVDFTSLLESTCETSRWQAHIETIANLATAEDACGCTALHIAAHSGCVEMAAELLNRGAHVNSPEAWDETPLHFAARANKVAICELLISHGADVNRANSNDETPLLVAAIAGKEDTCNFLLEKGGHTGGVSDIKVPELLHALLVQRMILPSAAINGPREDPSSSEEWGSSEEWE